MTKVRDLHKVWLKDMDYVKAYAALEPEFQRIAIAVALTLFG